MDASSPPPYQQHSSQDLSAVDYDPDTKDLIPITSTTRVLDFLYTKSYINIRIADSASNDVLYYVDNSSFNPNKPDVTLCRGDSKDGLIAGVCRWSHMYSKHFAIGVGNPTQDEHDAVWEEVRNDQVYRPVFKWSVGSPGNRSTFAWHRISKSDAQTDDDEANKFSRKSFKLVNCANEEILAVF